MDRLDPDELVTAADIARLIPSVSRHLVYVWRAQGKLTAKETRGRSPLYRWGDALAVEVETRIADPAQQRANQPIAA